MKTPKSLVLKCSLKPFSRNLGVKCSDDHDHDIIVCNERSNPYVQIYKPGGLLDHEMIRSTYLLIPKIVEDEAKCWYPSGIEIDDEENIYIADTRNHRVVKYNKHGAIVKSAGKYGIAEDQFHLPLGIRVHGDKVFVCDHGNHRIQILDKHLKSHLTFGKYGTCNDEFHQPMDIAFDRVGNAYIVNCGTKCVKKYTPEFKFLKQIGGGGNGDYYFQSPCNICVDADDRIFVTDRKKHCVFIFTCEGDFLHSFGKYGTKEYEFNHPRGIAVDRGQIYVCDTDNDRVQVFEICFEQC